MGFPHAKRRVTRDDKTGQIIECLEKTKVANLNVFSPNEEFDWRVSVNMEVPGMSLLVVMREQSNLVWCLAFSGSAAARETVV